MSGRMGRKCAGMLVLVGAAFVGTASAGHGGGGTTVETQGVVAFGVGVSGPTRGTYSMSPNGSGAHMLTSQIYPVDVSRGRTPATVLFNNAPAPGDLSAIRADGTGAAVALTSGANVPAARFSLDGNHVAYINVDRSGVPYVATIYLADVVRDGSGDVTGLANAASVYAGVGVAGFDLSRDASRVVFCKSDGLWILTRSSGALQHLTSTAGPGADSYPRWSPVDDRIAFQRQANVGISVADILTIDANTGAVKTVVAGSNNTYATYPCWSPDGVNLLVLGGGSKQAIDLCQIAAGGSGSLVDVTSGLGVQENTPAWGW